MGEQLVNWAGDKTVTRDLELVRNNTRKFTVTHGLGASSAIKEAYFVVENSDGTVIISLDATNHSTQWDLTTDDEATITLLPANSAGLTLASNHKYAVEVRTYDTPERIFTVQKGNFSIIDEVRDDGTTAAYLSWTTLEDYQTELQGIMAVGDLTQVTTAAASGAGSITVDHIRTIGDTDTIYVQLDDGTYESHTVSGAPSGTTITLTGTLGDDVAAGNFVRKV